MIRPLACLFVSGLVLTGSDVAHAQTDLATAESLMRSSGMWQQLAAVAPQVQAGLVQGIARAAANPSPAEIVRLATIVDAAYAADRLRSTAIATFKAQIQAAHVPALRRWYASALGKTITALEEAASNEQRDPQLVVRQGADMLSSMPADRRALLADLVGVTHSAETLVQITVDTALAAQRSANSVAPDAPATSIDELRMVLEAQRPRLLQAYAGLALASNAKAYATLPTSDLDQYVEFLKSDAGRHFTDVGLRAFTAALVEASAEFGRRLPGTRDKANT